MFFNFVRFCWQNYSTSIGIDIGNNYANLIKLHKNRDHTIVDYKTCVNDNISEALKNLSINNYSAVIALRYRSVLTKTITLDATLTYYEIKKYLFSHTEKYFALPSQQIYMDFAIFKKHPTKVEIRLIAAKRDLVDSLLALLSIINIKLRAVDVEHFALSRAVLSLFVPSNQEVICAINYKNGCLLFCFIKNQEILYANEVPILDNNFTSLIINELQLFFAINNIRVAQLILSGNDFIEKIDVNTIEEIMKSKITLTIADPLVNLPEKATIKHSSSFMLSYGLALWHNNHD
jgi:Tfp pilus assembly PilM family ATPase